MKQVFLLITIFTGSVFYTNAQSNIENSPFVNVPISLTFYPAPKKLSKQELKKVNGGDVLLESPIDFDLKMNYLRLPDGKTATFFTAQIENNELSFETINQIQTSSVNIFGRITSADKKIIGTFEDRIIFTAKATNLESKVLTEKQSYIKGIMLPPNDYKIVIFIRDSVSGKMGFIQTKFTVQNP